MFNSILTNQITTMKHIFKFFWAPSLHPVSLRFPITGVSRKIDTWNGCYAKVAGSFTRHSPLDIFFLGVFSKATFIAHGAHNPQT